MALKRVESRRQLNQAINILIVYLDHWKKALMGPIVGIGVLLYQQVTNRPLSWGWFWALVLAGLAWQFHSEYKKEKKTKRSEEPKLFLRPREVKSIHSFAPEFFVQVEGDRKAFGVQLMSDDSVGKDHGRLEVSWTSINEPVGNEPIPVSMYWHWRKRNESYTEDGLKGYMDYKLDPKELIVRVTFKDVDGISYPARRFKIYRQRDVDGNIKTYCDLFSGHAAS